MYQQKRMTEARRIACALTLRAKRAWLTFPHAVRHRWWSRLPGWLALFAMLLWSGAVMAQQGIGIGNTATDNSGTIGTIRPGESDLDCAANKVAVGGRHTDRQFAAPNSADGMTVNYDLLCATVTTDGATVTVTNDVAFTDFFQYDELGTLRENTCAANQVVGRAGGFDRSVGLQPNWPSSIRHLCHGLLLDANDWVERSLTVSATQDIGVNELNGIHNLRGPFCTNNSDTVMVGHHTYNGGEGFDGIQMRCGQFVQARFSAALDFVDYAWPTTLGGAGWNAQLTHTSGNMAVRMPRPAGTNNLAQLEPANEVYVIPGGGYSATPIAPAGVAANTYVITTACTGATRTDEQDLACPMVITGRPDIDVDITAPTTPWVIGVPRAVTVTATNLGPGATDNNDAMRVQFPLPTGYSVAGALPASCSQAADVVTCLLNPAPLAGSSAPGNTGGTTSWTFNLVASATSPASTTGTATLAQTIDADATNDDFQPANDTASAPFLLGTTVTITKISNGGVGSFDFAGSNGIAAHNIVTATSGVGVAGATQTLTAAGTVTTINEAAPPAGFALASITCTGLGAGGTATPTINGTSGGNVVLNAAATAAGSNIACTFINARQPILRLQKQLPSGRFVTSDQFSLDIGGSTVTTTGSGSTATGTVTVNPATIGTAYTFSETGAAGANLANYAVTYTCANALSGGQAPSGSGPSFSLTPVAGDDLTCTFVNTRNPLTDLSITKSNTTGTVTRGTTTTYTIVVTNNGPDAVTSAVVRDPAQTGLTCNDPVPCTGSGCPSPTVPLLTLQSTGGVVLGTIPNGGTVTFTLSCTVQ